MGFIMIESTNFINDVIRLLLIPYFLGYVINFIHLFSGQQSRVNKNIQIGLNLLLLTLFIYMIITDAFDNTFSGFILMFIIVSIISLGIIGSFMLDPTNIPMRTSLVKRLKYFDYSFLIIIFFYIGLNLIDIITNLT